MAKKKEQIVKDIAKQKGFGYHAPKRAVVSDTFKEVLARHGIKYGEPTVFPQVGDDADGDGDTGGGEE